MKYLTFELWNWQWLPIIGIIIAALGGLYSGTSYFGEREKSIFLRTLLRGFLFGMVIAILYGTAFLIYDIIVFLSSYLLHFYISSKFDLIDQVALAETLPDGMLAGLIVGFVYSLAKNSIKLDSSKVIIFLTIIGFLLIVASSAGFELIALMGNPLSPQELSGLILAFLVFGDLGGFILGLVVARVRTSWWKNSLFWLLGIVLLLALSSWLVSHRNYILEDSLDNATYYAITGYIVGIALYEWRQLRTSFTKISWKYSVFWLIIGSTILPLLFLILFGINARNNTMMFALFRFCNMLGIANAQVDKLIKQIRPRCRLLGKRRYRLLRNLDDYKYMPLVNWRRFVCGLVIGILCLLPGELIFSIANQQGALEGNLSALFLDIGYSVQAGLLIGWAYGFGPFIIFYTENLSESTLGQIGVLLTILGLIIIALPH